MKKVPGTGPKAAGRRKPWDQMTTAELAEATKEFDEEFVIDRTRPMNAAERARWERAKRGRPRVGKGSRAVSVTIEVGLLERADRVARQRGVTRARLIAEGLRRVVGKAR